MATLFSSEDTFNGRVLDAERRAADGTAHPIARRLPGDQRDDPIERQNVRARQPHREGLLRDLVHAHGAHQPGQHALQHDGHAGLAVVVHREAVLDHLLGGLQHRQQGLGASSGQRVGRRELALHAPVQDVRQGHAVVAALLPRRAALGQCVEHGVLLPVDVVDVEHGVGDVPWQPGAPGEPLVVRDDVHLDAAVRTVGRAPGHAVRVGPELPFLLEHGLVLDPEDRQELLGGLCFGEEAVDAGEGFPAVEKERPDDLPEAHAAARVDVPDDQKTERRVRVEKPLVEHPCVFACIFYFRQNAHFKEGSAARSGASC